MTARGWWSMGQQRDKCSVGSRTQNRRGLVWRMIYSFAMELSSMGLALPRRADIAVANGRIVEIGVIRDSAKQILTLLLVVAPGLLIHTRIMTHRCRDPLVSCSSWHGVTSVVMGNCGVGLAPCRQKQREALAWDLSMLKGCLLTFYRKVCCGSGRVLRNL
jgi:hypothetical protein